MLKAVSLFCALVWLFWGAGAAVANIAPDLGGQDFVEAETLEEPKSKDHLRLSGEHLSRGYAWRKCRPGLTPAAEADKVAPSGQTAVRK
jgi:hypothetical protein